MAAEIRTEEWRREHAWKVPSEAVERLAKAAEDQPIFLCGVVSNEHEFWGLFSKVIALMIDEQILIQRLRDRPNNNFGKSAHELRDVLEWQQGAVEGYKKAGATLVDATKPIEEVVDTILKITAIKS